MKKFILTMVLVYTVLILVVCTTGSTSTGRTVPLDQAIQEAAMNIENRLGKGEKIALLNFSSPSELFSEYVLEELSRYLVNNGKLVVVERRELDLIRQEEQFQLTGEASDESAQAIGKKLGAQIIISGSLTSIGREYLIRIKALAVETAVIAATASSDINPKEKKVKTLLGGIRLVVETVQEDAPIEGLLYELIDGRTVTITKYIGSKADVRIPALIQNLPVTTIGNRAFYDCSNLTSIIIPSSVTTIARNAFSSYHWTGEENSEKNSNLTSDRNSTPSIFAPALNVNAFNVSSGLTNISVDSWNSVYMSIDGVLFDKSGRTLICYPEGKSGAYTIPLSTTVIERGAFYHCRRLTSVTIPTSVTMIGDSAFFGCSSLTSVTIPSSVTTIGNVAFYDTNLTNVTLSRRTRVEGYAFNDDVRIQYRD